MKDEATFRVEEWPRFKADAVGRSPPAYGCQAWLTMQSKAPAWCAGMLKLRRPYGLDMLFHNADHFGTEECKFPNRSVAG